LSNGEPRNSLNIFLRLYYAFIKTPRQKLLRGIDHSIVVTGFLFLITTLWIAGSQSAIIDPVESQYHNLFIFSATTFIFIGAFGFCEFLTRYLINPYRQ